MPKGLKFKTVQIDEQTKARLEAICKITKLSQNSLLSMLIDKIWENSGQYESASILVDDSSCRVSSLNQNIVIEIRGLLQNPYFIYGVKSENG